MRGKRNAPSSGDTEASNEIWDNKLGRHFADSLVAKRGPEKLGALIVQGSKIGHELRIDRLGKAGGLKRTLHYLIQRFLEDYHRGLIPEPNINATEANVVPGTRLLVDFINAVVRGDANYVRRIAEALPNVYANVRGSGATFEVEPANPQFVKVSDHIKRQGLPKNVKEMAEIMRNARMDVPADDLRTARQWYTWFTARKGKSGRPPKGGSHFQHGVTLGEIAAMDWPKMKVVKKGIKSAKG